MSERVVAELIARLGRIAHGDGFIADLTPAQWSALRYFERANQFSRTPSAFAEFHSTTRGTASQTIKSLIARGYLVRTRSEADGRSARLDLTDKARAILGKDPFDALVRASGALSPSARGRVADALGEMIDYVAREYCKPPFGSCTSCEHLQGEGFSRDGEPSYRCRTIGEPLAESELQQLCINFAPDRHSAMKRIFAKGKHK